MVKSFAELGLQFSHQVEQFAFLEPIVLKIRNAALQFLFFICQNTKMKSKTT